MKKLVMVFALLMVVGSLNVVNAQSKKISLGVHGAANPNKIGVGVHFGYDFTKLLRFTIDGNYYLTAKEKMDVFYGPNNSAGSFINQNSLDFYEGTKLAYTLNKGRLWDANINLNFVFGDKNFHFYLLSGLGFTYGYKFGLVADKDICDNNGNVIGHGITKNQMDICRRIGVSLNAGCGIEWQISPAIRWNLEQAINIGIPALTTWMCKTGVSYCF